MAGSRTSCLRDQPQKESLNAYHRHQEEKKTLQRDRRSRGYMVHYTDIHPLLGLKTPGNTRRLGYVPTVFLRFTSNHRSIQSGETNTSCSYVREEPKSTLMPMTNQHEKKSRKTTQAKTSRATYYVDKNQFSTIQH